jgi:apolipoprotein D and lipocalin family protein
MKAVQFFIAGVFAVAVACGPVPVAAQEADAAPLQPVPKVDLARYAGTWYEIALYPNMFQRRCAADTQANYAPLPEGQIEVRNRCSEADGKTAEVVGRARTVNASGSMLKVRFAPAWLSWLPFVWADYWVIQLADDYRYAVVGEPDREYLWVLSRTPVMGDADKAVIWKQLIEQGYAPGRLQFTPQKAAQQKQP